MVVNAHELVGSFQTVYWNEWKEGKILEFELVDCFRSLVFKEGNGLYQVYYAIARSEDKTLGMREGDDIFLHVSWRALVKALSKVPVEQKIPCLKKNADGKNIFIRIEKLTSKSMKIHWQEPREPTVEQLENAGKYYEIIKAEHQDS